MDRFEPFPLVIIFVPKIICAALRPYMTALKGQTWKIGGFIEPLISLVIFIRKLSIATLSATYDRFLIYFPHMTALKG